MFLTSRARRARHWNDEAETFDVEWDRNRRLWRDPGISTAQRYMRWAIGSISVPLMGALVTLLILIAIAAAT